MFRTCLNGRRTMAHHGAPTPARITVLDFVLGKELRQIQKKYEKKFEKCSPAKIRIDSGGRKSDYSVFQWDRLKLSKLRLG